MGFYMSELLSLPLIVHSEKVTVGATRNLFKGTYRNIPEILDVFFKLSYFIGETEDPETDKGGIQSVNRLQFIQSPYTFWTIYNLYEKGYYLEGIILYRHLLEAFIQMRYFNKHPQRLEQHIQGIKRVNFSAMFNEFSPGFYKPYYQKQLSEAVHGVLFKDIFRVDREEKRTRLGSEFHVDHATFIMNYCVPLILGYFNWFEHFFPNNTLNTDKDISNKFNNSKRWLESCFEGHKKANPRSETWHNHMKTFISIN